MRDRSVGTVAKTPAGEGCCPQPWVLPPGPLANSCLRVFPNIVSIDAALSTSLDSCHWFIPSIVPLGAPLSKPLAQYSHCVADCLDWFPWSPSEHWEPYNGSGSPHQVPSKRSFRSPPSVTLELDSLVSATNLTPRVTVPDLMQDSAKSGPLYLI